MSRDISVRQIEVAKDGGCTVEGCETKDKFVFRVNIGGRIIFRICKGCFDEMANKLHEAKDIFKKKGRAK